MTDLLQIGAITDAMKQRLEEVFTITSDPGPTISHVVTNGHDGVPAEVMAACPNLKLISCYGVGYDAIDTSDAIARGAIVTHTPDVLNAEVASTAIMLLLACFRELLRDDAHVRSGAWAREGNAPLSRSMDNRTIGILGLGRIGQAIADKLGPWSPTILYHTRTPKDVPYEYCSSLVQMAERCDALIVITPGGQSTRHLVTAEVLKALGPAGTLVNVSRGSVVDEAALITALQDGTLGWAGLDVFENEPQVPQALREMANVVLTPHVGSATEETRHAMGMLTVDNLIRHLTDGTVLTPVPECR